MKFLPLSAPCVAARFRAYPLLRVVGESSSQRELGPVPQFARGSHRSRRITNPGQRVQGPVRTFDRQFARTLSCLLLWKDDDYGTLAAHPSEPGTYRWPGVSCGTISMRLMFGIGNRCACSSATQLRSAPFRPRYVFASDISPAYTPISSSDQRPRRALRSDCPKRSCGQTRFGAG